MCSGRSKGVVQDTAHCSWQTVQEDQEVRLRSTCFDCATEVADVQLHISEAAYCAQILHSGLRRCKYCINIKSCNKLKNLLKPVYN